MIDLDSKKRSSVTIKNISILERIVGIVKQLRYNNGIKEDMSLLEELASLRKEYCGSLDYESMNISYQLSDSKIREDTYNEMIRNHRHSHIPPESPEGNVFIGGVYNGEF